MFSRSLNNYLLITSVSDPAQNDGLMLSILNPELINS